MRINQVCPPARALRSDSEKQGPRVICGAFSGNHTDFSDISTGGQQNGSGARSQTACRSANGPAISCSDPQMLQRLLC